MTTRPLRLAATVSTLAVSAFGLAVMAGPAAMAAQTTQSVQNAQSTAMHHGTERTQFKGAAGDSCDPGDGDTGTLDDVGDCIDN